MENRNGQFNTQYSGNGYYSNQNGSAFNQYGTYTGTAYNCAPFTQPQHKDPFINSEAKHITRLSVLAGAAVLSFLGMQNIMSILLSAFGLSSLYMSNYNFQMIFGMLCSVFCIFVPFMTVYGLYSKGDREKCFEYGEPVSKKAFGLAVFAGLMVCFLSNYIASGFNCFVGAFGVTFADVDMKAPSNFGEFLFFTLECAVVPALVEEFAIRGVIMQPLRRYGDRFAIAMSAIVFALMHGNMMQIPFALIAGFALGYAAIATKSIWTSTVIHFANNFFAVIVTTLSESKNEDAADIIITMMMFAVIAAGIICAVKFIKTEHYGLGLTFGPKVEKILFLGASAAFVFVSYIVWIFETVLPVLYLGSAAVVVAFFFIYRSVNRRALGAVPVTGLPEKLMTSLYVASPTVILGFYSLIVMTANFVTLNGVGGYLFCLMLFAFFYVVSIAALHNINKTTLLENKKSYHISTAILIASGIFTFVFMILMLFR